MLKPYCWPQQPIKREIYLAAAFAVTLALMPGSSAHGAASTPTLTMRLDLSSVTIRSNQIRRVSAVGGKRARLRLCVNADAGRKLSALIYRALGRLVHIRYGKVAAARQVVRAGSKNCYFVSRPQGSKTHAFDKTMLGAFSPRLARSIIIKNAKGQRVRVYSKRGNDSGTANVKVLSRSLSDAEIKRIEAGVEAELERLAGE